MYALKVKKQEAQNIIQALKKEGLINKEYKIKKQDNEVVIPLNRYIENAIELPSSFFVKNKPKTSVKALLKQKGITLSSFDIIGDVAIVFIKNGINEKEVADAITSLHNVKAVYKRLPVEGLFRVRKLELIKGKDVNEVFYKENGIKMVFNPKTVFFSSRLAYERLRVAKSVKGKNILVLFAGVGPFALIIAKMHPKSFVKAVEINPEAVKYFKRNITLNKLSNVEVIEGDVRAVLKNEEKKWDEIVMPLPKDAEKFLKDVEKVVKKGTVIYIYTFVPKENFFESIKNKIDNNFSLPYKIRKIRKVREYSPTIDEYVVEIVVS